MDIVLDALPNFQCLFELTQIDLIVIIMSAELKNKLNANAKHFRYLSRAETFHRNRKSVQQLDYLKYYTPEKKQAILTSLELPIPSPLPPLSPETISYYRRSNRAIYRTRTPEMEMDGHMLYESLWILASLEEKEFENSQAVIKQFQQDLPLYLSVNSVDIREMAIMAAGNKIIGKQADILKIVENDARQLWVLINHTYEKKVSFKALLHYVPGHYEIVFKTLWELTSNKEDEAIPAIVKDEPAMEAIISALHSKNGEIKRYAVRIVGNIIAEEGEYTDTLHRYKLVENVFELFMSDSQEIRRDGCWLVSNLCCDRNSATIVIRNQKIMTKLVQLFNYQTNVQIQRELTHIFAGLARNASKYQTFTLLAHENLLQICYNHLCLEDNDLSTVTLFLLNELIELGESCKGEQQANVFGVMIERMGELRNQISKKSYSQHSEISSLSIQIMNFLQQNQQ